MNILRRIVALLNYLRTGRLDVAELVAVDAAGRRRVVLTAGDGDKDSPGVTVLDDAGRERVYFILTPNGPAIALYGRDRFPRALLEAVDKLESKDVFVADGVSLSLSDGTGMIRSSVVVSPADTKFVLNGGLIYEEPVGPVLHPDSEPT